jgi:HSP20 family protein
MKNQNFSDTEEIQETSFLDEELEEFGEDTKKIPGKKNQVKKIQVEADDTPARQNASADSESWFGKEGELAIDVYQTDTEIVIQSAIAGVRAEDLDIQIENDVVTIRGMRSNPNEQEEKEYFHEECFWGPFARQVFLPEEIDVKNVEAAMKEGIFSLRLPKMRREQSKKVKIAKNK